MTDALIRGAILERDGYRCVRCGKHVGYVPASVHHRILGNRKDMRASNLITLCGSGTTGCHGWVHEHPNEAKGQGWIVSRFVQRTTTTSTPVKYPEGWFCLADNLAKAAAGGRHEARDA